ncbi:hypothetical protein Ciccas_007153 [Cichlidogyrus casuarinus]|uniref:Uncharacterized protein n=1 Tax=Cichlidogyrus casuarinus TaxID=1844966 RepID=A0ABD2Q4A8_9PLAT
MQASSSSPNPSRRLISGLNRIRFPTSSLLKEAFLSRIAEPAEVTSHNSFLSSTALQVDAWLTDSSMVKLLMSLCAGNHALFMRRRQPDSVEVQQMRAQAREEKTQRELERLRLERAKAEKAEVLEEKLALENRCARLEHALRVSGILDPSAILEETLGPKRPDEVQIEQMARKRSTGEDHELRPQTVVTIHEEEDGEATDEQKSPHNEEFAAVQDVSEYGPMGPYRLDFRHPGFPTRRCQTQPNTPLMNPRFLNYRKFAPSYDPTTFDSAVADFDDTSRFAFHIAHIPIADLVHESQLPNLALSPRLGPRSSVRVRLLCLNL